MTAVQATPSALPRDFFCEHSASKSRVLVLLAHPDGPSSLQAVMTCKDALVAQHAALLLSLAARNGILTAPQQNTAGKLLTVLPDAPAASFRQALDQARAGVWPAGSPGFTWPSDDPFDWVQESGTEEALPVSAIRTPRDARLADLPGPVIRVVQLREFHVYDQAKALTAAAASGWEPAPQEELTQEDPHDLTGAVMFAAETTGDLPGADCLNDTQEGQLLLSAQGDEVADWSAEPVRVDFGSGWRLHRTNRSGTASSTGAVPESDQEQPDFAALFALPAACDCEEEDCRKCDWTLTPRTAELLYSALVELAESAYDDAAELGDRPVIKDDDGAWGFFSRLPQVTWRQNAQWRRGLARACDDLAGDLASGRWPRPVCAAEEMVLHLALDDALEHLEAGDGSPHAALPTHRDDYDFDACSDFFFQDHDVLWLYDSKYSEDAGEAEGREPVGVPPALHPDNWFEDFLNVPARSPERGYRR
ncbi:hypothetical protein EJC51_47075 [Streptomyces aquilus]|uniref:Uncharacterized protein n=1 Tax=Streptomyces aquilus TaxID=2548456 RepID=A0A3S9HRR7_9ACTN|nr:hypothetical protein [Streptomyces aquilus]AZP14774.1 hypothetical protein EJC51_00470 [Streptomyces aquilus]AZP22930.1 hypothetical protein EJC51_47075 [Streptomyces aquilus]